MKISVYTALLFLGILWTSLLSADAQADNDALIIGHPATAVSAIKRAHARSIFSMRAIQWSDGSKITVFVLDDNSELHQQFCRLVLGLLPHQLRRSWDRATYTGRAKPPIRVSNVEQMLRLVAKTPGAIGYISSKFDIKSQYNVQIIDTI